MFLCIYNMLFYVYGRAAADFLYIYVRLYAVILPASQRRPRQGRRPQWPGLGVFCSKILELLFALCFGSDHHKYGRRRPIVPKLFQPYTPPVIILYKILHSYLLVHSYYTPTWL